MFNHTKGILRFCGCISVTYCSNTCSHYSLWNYKNGLFGGGLGWPLWSMFFSLPKSNVTEMQFMHHAIDWVFCNFNYMYVSLYSYMCTRVSSGSNSSDCSQMMSYLSLHNWPCLKCTIPFAPFPFKYYKTQQVLTAPPFLQPHLYLPAPTSTLYGGLWLIQNTVLSLEATSMNSLPLPIA